MTPPSATLRDRPIPGRHAATRRTPRLRRSALATLLLLASCTSSRPLTPAEAKAATLARSEWIGTITPVRGICDPAADAYLSLRHGQVLFTPNVGVLQLRGTANASGALTASLTTPGMNRQSYRLRFTGQLAGERITGSYDTPRCHASVTLHRA